MTAFLVVLGLIFLFVFLKPIFASLGKSSDLTAMIKKYKGDYLNPQLIKDLYYYCDNHEILKQVIQKHNATIKDFGVIYIYLIQFCNVEGKGHFIPISTFFFASSLDYALSKKSMWTAQDNVWLMKYFDLY